MDLSEQPRGAVSLLFVEDDPIAQRIATLLIAHRFPEIVILRAENGRAGLELFRAQRPEIVITDLSMPVMDGIRMAKEIRALAPDAVIVAITAHSDANYLTLAAEAGIDRYLMKPLDRNKLFEEIEACLATINRRQEEEVP